MTQAVLSLGANLGDAAAALQRAVDELARHGRPVAVSAVYRTAPVGGPEQPDYSNAVLILDTELTAAELLEAAQRVEADAGRVRLVRWGPRTLDVDLIAFGEVRSDDPRLTLPHPRAHERAFVLVPWLEADPDATLPGRGRVADLLGSVGLAGVHRLSQPRLRLPGAQPARGLEDHDVTPREDDGS